MRVGTLATSALAAGLCAAACSQPAPAGSASPSMQTLPPAAHVAHVTAVRATASMPHDVDDPAIWVNRADPANSLVFATMKVPAPDGALVVFGLDGKVRRTLGGLDRPNNVDVEYGLDLDGTPTDIAAVTERFGRRLRVYGITRGGEDVRDISAGGLAILRGAEGDEGAPMGIALYRRPRDGAIFAIVAPKAGPTSGYLWQYQLRDDGTGHVGATLIRRLGTFSGSGEIEAVVVDDERGFVYYADEGAGIHQWHADPDAPGADRELSLFATSGYQRDREGIGIYTAGQDAGYIVSTDQLPGQSVFHVYARQGEPGRPYEHRELFQFTGGADGTDGLDVVSAALGPEFPDGLLVAMNSAGRNFLFFRWADVLRSAAVALAPLQPPATP